MAERYFQTEPGLQALQPFTSEDIDFKGGKQDVKRIAEQLRLAEVYPSKVAMTALAGSVPFQIGDLKSNIEIVRSVPGISGSIDALAIQAELEGKIYVSSIRFHCLRVNWICWRQSRRNTGETWNTSESSFPVSARF